MKQPGRKRAVITMELTSKLPAVSERFNKGNKGEKTMTFEEVKEVIVETLSCDEEDITPEALLADDLGIDSLDAVELVLALEESCGVRIPDEALADLKTVQDVIDCLEKYKG